MNRRNFLRSAAGLLVASTALAVPERKVWALDQTMIPEKDPRILGTNLRDVDVSPGRVFINGQEYPVSGPGSFVDCGAGNVYINGQCADPRTVTMGEHSTGIEKYDLIRVNGAFGYWYGEDKFVRGWQMETIPPDAEIISWREAFARSPFDDRPLTLGELSQAMRDTWEAIGR